MYLWTSKSTGTENVVDLSELLWLEQEQEPAQCPIHDHGL